MEHGQTHKGQTHGEANANLTRRSFLAGAALAGIGVGTAGVLGGCATGEVQEASGQPAADSVKAQASETKGSKYPWPATPPEIPVDEVEEEIEADAVIVGLGVAGCAAFRAACEEGAAVVAVEKAAAPQCRSDQYCYVNGSMTERLGLPQLDVEKLVNEEWEASGKYADYSIIRKFILNEAEAFDWWCDGVSDLHIPEVGEIDSVNAAYLAGTLEYPCAVSTMVYLSADYENEPKAFYPSRLYFSNHAHVLEENVARGVEAGGKAYIGHFAEQLIMDGETVKGVYARNAETGKYKKITSRNGVVLSAGGCEGDEDMARTFYPAMSEYGNLSPWPNTDVEGNLTNTGDAFRMGGWAGAAFSAFMAPMCHVMGGPNDVADMAGSVGLTTPHLHLNYNGVRFMNEDADCADVEPSIERQPETKCFLICDSHLDEQAALSYDPTKKAILSGSTYTCADLDKRVDNETVFKADTVEDLLKSIPGMNVEEALKSIERYNGFCAAGVDEDFSKQQKYLWPVQDAPFYAQRVGQGLCLTTMGGLYSDNEARVYNEKKKVIPGLYAAGNCQGNRFAVKYPFKLSGASHAMAMYYGYVAGKNVGSAK